MKLVDPDKPWFVLRCFTGREREAAYELHRLGYDAYCPTKRVETIHHRTKATIIKEKPLLEGYLFAAQPRKVGEETRVDFGAMEKKPERHEDPKVFRKVLRIKRDGEFIPVPGEVVQGYQIAEMDMAFDDTRAAKIHRGEIEKTREAEMKKRFPVGSTVFAEGVFRDLPGVITKHLKTGRVKIDYDAVTVEVDMESLKPAA